MFGGGKGPMGGGGGMLRAASRAVTRAGVGNLQDPFSSSSSSSTNIPASNNASSHGCSSGTATTKQTQKPNSCGSGNLTISTSGSLVNFPVAANSGIPAFGGGAFASVNSGVYDDFDWVSVDGTGSDDDFLLGPVPSVDEVQDAVSALQQVFDMSSYSHLVRDRYECNFNKVEADRIPSSTGRVRRVSSVGSELDWMEPSMQLYNPRMLQSHGYHRVYDAFHLLRTEPSVQRMVVSLSSDKAIWDAVMNNEVVREIKELYNNAVPTEEKDSKSLDEASDDTNPATDFIKWVFDGTKAKVMEMFEKLTKLVTEFFKVPNDEKTKGKGTSDPFGEKLRTSVFLSIIVLLVVVVTRTSRA